jgi:hypothetical protein
MTRRQFMTLSTASLLVNRQGRLWAESPPWYTTMRRCGQINFNEKDPLTLDVEAWADYWASLKVNAVLLNGGGILAFYPTQVPFHRRSQYLGSRDLFGEMVAATKQRDLRVVARMDCNLAYDEALQAHPEWFERNQDGSPRRHDECPWLYRTCMFSTYFSEQMPMIYREINQGYPVDGFFTNGWPATGPLRVCYCLNCQRVYREKVGGEPPENTDARSRLYRKYYQVYMDRIQEIWKLWDSVAKEKTPHSIYVGNLGGGIDTVKNLWSLGRVAGWFNADHQGRSGDTVIWDCAQQGRVAQAVMKGRTITNVTGAYSNSQPIWRHVSKSAAETILWMAQTVASGMVPWFHWLGGSPEDNRWREVGRSFFQWLAENEPHFRNHHSLANLAVLYPQNTVAFCRSGNSTEKRQGPDTNQTVDYLQGLYYALLEGRFLFDFIHQDDLSLESLRGYKALLLPNAAYLSDHQCDQIRQFVSAGGSLLATFETSRYNEWGDPRNELGLADAFGVHLNGEVIGPLGNSYARIELEHPLTEHFEGTCLLPGAENRLSIKPNTATPVLTVVPYYPAFPPEMVFPRQSHTQEPAAVFREAGSSRVVYFTGDIDRTFWRSGNPDLSQMIQNAVHWILGGMGHPLCIKGDGILEVFGWKTECGYALHLLNYTNPNMTRSFIRHFYPIGPLQVDLSVPSDTRLSRARELRAGRDIPFKQTSGRVKFEVPKVADYEVIALT